MTLIEHIHLIHVKRALFVPECLLCDEARRKAEKAQPKWLANLGAKDMTRGVA